MLTALLLLAAAMPAVMMVNHRGIEDMRKNWERGLYSTKSSYTLDQHDGFQIPPDDVMRKVSTKEYSFFKRRALSIENVGKSGPSKPPFPLEVLETPPISQNEAHPKKHGDLHVVTKRKHDKKRYSQKFKYDPALMLMGLGKRDPSHQHNKTVIQKRSVHEPGVTYSNLEHKRIPKNIRKNDDVQWKLSAEVQPLMMIRKSADTSNKQNSSDNGMLDSGSVQMEDYLQLPDTLEDSKSDKLKDEWTGSSDEEIPDDGSRTSKRSSSYDPALKYMGLGKKNSYYDPALKYMGLGKKSSSYDPALRYMGLGKKNSYYDPALKYMGLGKKSSSYDPALKYMGLGKKDSYYDPALKYMGLGKKGSGYDPALRYMGLGKRNSNYDPALKYMGLGKKSSNYDPALRYMGLGKKDPHFDPALKYMGLGKKGSGYDPALRYMGLGKRDSYYDPALKYMGLGKKSSSYDPALKYMGLGKRGSSFDPALKYMGLGKRGSSFDPALKYMGLGKRVSSFDPALKYMGLGKRGSSFDPALKYMGLGKRGSSFDPALKYMGLGKRVSSYDPALKYMGLGKKSSTFDPALKYMGLGKKRSNYDPALKYMGLGKKSKNYDPALKYMGLGKRSKNDRDTRGDNNQNSGKVSYDPALIYMGLGKRWSWSEISDNFSFRPSFNYGEAYKQAYSNYVQRKNSLTPTPKKNNYETTDYAFRIPENSTVSNSFSTPLKSKDNNYRAIDYNSEGNSKDKKSYANDPVLHFMRTSTAKESESRSTGKKRYNYPDPKFVQKLVEHFDSQRPNNGENTPSVTDYEISDSSGNFFLKNKIFSHGDYLSNSWKKRAIRDSPLSLGLGNETDNVEFETRLPNQLGGECLTTCEYSTRKKRDVNREENRPSRITSPNFSLKTEHQVQLPYDPRLDDIIMSNSNGRLLNLQESKFKRERDNRPKYNPGWIFIGLGKRSPEETLESPKIIQMGNNQWNNQMMDKPNSLLGKYYNLMDKIKERLQKVKYDLIDKGHRHNEKWVAFHNYFTGGYNGYPEIYYPLNQHGFGKFPGVVVNPSLPAPPLNVEPRWKVIVPAYKNPSNLGK